MSKIIKITGKPTFDLQEVYVINFDEENRFCYFKSGKIFKFENVFGNLENRSRVLRVDKDESKYVEHVVSASIDAGFCGYLVWKTKLTKEGVKLIKNLKSLEEASPYFENCQQLHLFPSPAGNYYDGTNQTELKPDVIFTL